jgi:hypothetical protein
MGSYHRTQVLLEPWQHAALKALAEREGVSISDLLRRVLTRQLRPRSRRRRPLQAIAGIGRDRKASGRDHDRWLYGPGAPK